MATRERAVRSRAWLLSAVALVCGCSARESPEAARDRAAESFLLAQIEDLKRSIARVDKGELASRDRIAISVSETIVKQLIDATLPHEVTVAGRYRVRIESAEPLFRGSNAALVFQAVASGLEPGSPAARVELGGSLERVRVEDGTLMADVSLAHFKVLDTSLGDLAGEAVERLVADNRDALAGLLPTLEIPVHLEQSVDIAGLDAGVVVAQAGTLPLKMTVAEVVAVRHRLWVFVDAQAGPWASARVSAIP
jgi:hypothetical protein